jgi:hypothetical protein
LGTKSSDLATLEEKRRQCEEIEQTGDVLLRTIQSLRQSASLHEANMRSAVVESTNIYIKMSLAAGDLQSLGYCAEVRSELLGIVSNISDRLALVDGGENLVSPKRGKIMPSSFELRYGVLRISSRQSLFRVQRQNLSKRLAHLREHTP